MAAFLAFGLLMYVLYRNFAPEIDAEQILQDVSEGLGKWTYLLVGLLAFLETGAFVGLIAPGETAVILGGAVAGQDVTSLWLTIAIVWAGAYAGDSVSYLIGRKLGRNFALERGPRVGITRERLTRVEDYFDRHGGKTILIGRFIGLVRALAPFIAGSSGMQYRQMAPYSVLGTGIWAAFFTVLGYLASQNIDAVVHAAESGASYIAAAAALAVGVYFARRYLREPENRRRVVAEMESRPVLRQLLGAGRVVRPQAEFLWQRLTPGGLGLEFTSLIAAAAVGGFAFIAYADEVDAEPGPTALDDAAIDIAREIESGFLTGLADLITTLGSGPVVAGVALIAAIWLLRARRPLEAALLVVSYLVVATVVPELKDAIGRPRPPDALRDLSSEAYPSGHAAYSMIYAWLAVSAVVRWRPGLPGGAAIILIGLLLTLAVGMTRVYLRVHWMSDVIGGWGLSLAVFSLAGAVALLVHHLRQNGRDGVGAPGPG